MAIWKWSDIGQYSTTSTYHMLCEGSICFLCTMVIWHCWAPLSCKFFLWPALQYPFGRLIGDCDMACKTKALSLSFVIKNKTLWIISSFNVCSLGKSSTYVLQGQRSLFRFLWWQIGLNLGGWYVSIVSTFQTLLPLFWTLICMIWMELTRTDAVFSKIALVLFLCRNKSSRNDLKLHGDTF